MTPPAPRPIPNLTPVICGPTAGGKSDLAVDLALALRDRHSIPAEIITADAFQVYTGLDIGTAKPTTTERRGVPHHLIDIVPALGTPALRAGRIDSLQVGHPSTNPAPTPPMEPDSSPGPEGRPTQAFTLDHWLSLANQTITNLRARHILPIVVGGTHLYIKALLEGLFDGPEPDPQLRVELVAMDPAARRAELERADPIAAARIHPNDARRTIRALEVFRQTGKPMSAHQKQWDRNEVGSGKSEVGSRDSDRPPTSHLPPPTSHFQLILLDYPAEILNPRINARVKHMLERGLLDEVRSLIKRNAFTPQSREALGYKQLIPLVERALAENCWPPLAHELEEAVEKIKIETRRFAKNQRTWLRRLSATPGALTLAAQDRPNWLARVLRATVGDNTTAT